MRRLILIFVGCFFSLAALAQNEKDAGMWLTANIDYKLNSNWKVLFTQELRLKENFSELNLFYNNLGIEYSPIKGIKSSLVYRLIEKMHPSRGISFRNRWMWDVVLKKEWARWNFSYRSRIQVEYRDYFTSTKGKEAEWYWRHRFLCKYDLSQQWSPYAAAEFRYQGLDPRGRAYDGAFHRMRYQVGVDYKLSKKMSLGTYGLYQHDFDLPKGWDLFILGLEWNYEF